MVESISTDLLLRKVRHGDEAATRLFATRYRPVIRLAFRCLADRAGSSFCESVKLCQAVVNCFLLRLHVGQFDLETPKDLHHALFRITRGFISLALRFEHGNWLPEDRCLLESSGDGSALHGIVSASIAKLPALERRIIELRQSGACWQLVCSTTNTAKHVCQRIVKETADKIASQLGIVDIDPDEVI